jgi:hypothetical protein
MNSGVFFVVRLEPLRAHVIALITLPKFTQSRQCFGRGKNANSKERTLSKKNYIPEAFASERFNASSD